MVDADVIPNNDEDFAARDAHRATKKEDGERKRNEGEPSKETDKAKGGGRTLNGLKRLTGLRSRC